MADAAIDAVARVDFVAFDVELCAPGVVTRGFDLEMYLRRGSAGIDDGFDRAEIVFAVGAREESSEALEVIVGFAESFEKCPTAEIGPSLAARYLAWWGPCLVRLGRFDQAEAPSSGNLYP